MRAAILCAGLAVLAAAWFGPLPELARHSFAAHMALHLAVVALAAPLVALGMQGSRVSSAVAALGPVAAVAAAMVEFVVIWAWHAPALHAAARTSAVGLALEQGSFLAVGCMMWLAAFAGGPRDKAFAATGVIGLLLTSMHMTLLGTLIGLAPRPLYEHAVGGVQPVLSAIDDQHLGGMLMIGVGGIVYLVGGLVLASRLLRPDDETEPRAKSLTSTPLP